MFQCLYLLKYIIRKKQEIKIPRPKSIFLNFLVRPPHTIFFCYITEQILNTHRILILKINACLTHLHKTLCRWFGMKQKTSSFFDSITDQNN